MKNQALRAFFMPFGTEMVLWILCHPDTCVRIPMRNHLRSLNLSNSVAIAVYEVLRQYDFEGLQVEGQLTTHIWGEGQL